MTHKEFFIWLKGYIVAKQETNTISTKTLSTIHSKMGEVDGYSDNVRVPPSYINDEDMGKPPNIVM